MKIDLHSTIEGIPIRQIKRVFKKSEYIDAEFLKYELNVDGDQANKLIAELCAQGFLEESELRARGFITTSAGKRLAATSAQRISNLKAHELFNSFLERLDRVNSEECEYAYWVDRVILGGSFLEDPGQSDFGDIDLFVRLKAKFTESQKQKELNWTRILATTKSFPTVLEQMNWPRAEVVKYLKNRSRYLSITEVYDSDIDLEPENSFTIIYEADSFPAKDTPSHPQSDAIANNPEGTTSM